MLILSIDPGLKNLGWALYDTTNQSFKSFGRYNLVKDQPKDKKTKYSYLVKSFIDASKDVFEAADVIAIEIQMVAKFKVIATAFQCFFWEKAVLVSPRSVRCYFKISMGNYSKNKKASVNIIPSLDIPASNKERFKQFDKQKRDDVADAILIALYWAEKGGQTTKTKKRKRVYKQ